MAFVSEQCDTELDDSPANVPVWAVYMTAFRFLGALTQEPRTIIYIDGFNLYYGALKAPRKNYFTLTARAMWRRHSCVPRPDSSGRLLGVLQSASRGVEGAPWARQSETLRHAGG